MRPGRTVRPPQVDDAGSVRRRLAGAKDGLDAAVRDQDLAVREDLARVDVQESARSDDEVIGHGGRC